jgi:protein-S-isoprenylcysteine O-methyltransferase Ste14
MSTGFRERGGAWVVIQFVLMGAGLGLSPLVRGDWGNGLTRLAAALCFIVAAVTGLLGVRGLRWSRTAFPRPKDDATLITTGIYSWMRHPLYVSVTAIGFGWALAWSSRLGLSIAFVLACFLDAKARHEERLLCAKFPDYADYMRRVKRFVPGVY